jgi:IS5 family transposase
VLASKSLEGNPYDGHTLSTTMDQVVALSGVKPDRIYVDLGYRGLTPTIKRELRRRSAIGPMIGT